MGIALWLLVGVVVAFLFLWLVLGRDPEAYKSPFSFKSMFARAFATTFTPGDMTDAPTPPTASPRARAAEDKPSPPHRAASPARVYDPEAPHIPASPRLAPPSNRGSMSSGSEGADIDRTPALLPSLMPATEDHERSPSTSGVYESLTHKVVEHIFQKKFRSRVRTIPWLVNDRPDARGRFHPLEFDIYNDELKIAVEYQGVQHFKWPNFYHPKTPKGFADFKEQVRRDDLKLDLADEHGVYLISVPHNCHSTGPKASSEIEKWIRYYLPSAVMERQERAAKGAEVELTMHEV